MYRTTRSFIGALAVLALAVGGVFFDAPARAQSSKSLTEVNIRLDWKPGAQHAPFYYAKQKGYYAEEGIDLKIITGSGSSDAVKQLGSRAVELALVDGLVLVQAIEQKVPVKAVAAYYQRSPITVISPKAKPITSIKQLLEGAKLGTKKGSATYQGLLAFLAANGIKQEQVTIVDVGFGVQPLLVGQVDALMGFTMNEPIQAESAGTPVQEMLIADHGVKAYGLTLSSNDRFMKEHGDLVAGFLRATKRSMREASKNQRPVVEALAKAISEVDVERELKVLAKVLPFWSSPATAKEGYGWQTAEAWRETVNTAKTLGLIKTALAAESIYTTAFIKP